MFRLRGSRREKRRKLLKILKVMLKMKRVKIKNPETLKCTISKSFEFELK